MAPTTRTKTIPTLVGKLRRIRGIELSRNIEVVVLGADSREALERTHALYFRTPGELAQVS